MDRKPAINASSPSDSYIPDEFRNRIKQVKTKIQEKTSNIDKRVASIRSFILQNAISDKPISMIIHQNDAYDYYLTFEDAGDNPSDEASDGPGGSLVVQKREKGKTKPDLTRWNWIEAPIFLKSSSLQRINEFLELVSREMESIFDSIA